MEPAGPFRILIVEDDPRMLDVLRRGLWEHGHTVMTASDGIEGLTLAQTYEYDVVLLDVGLPLRNGYEVAASLRAQQNHAVVLMLTAYDMEDDIIRGLDLGADDYMTKPFSFPELLARIGSITRRRPSAPSGFLKSGELVLDKLKRTISLAGVPLSLTPTEFLLLERLMEEPGTVVARKQLIEKVWGADAEVSPGALDTFINSLRGKLNHAEQRNLIGTVRGTGYFLFNEASAVPEKGTNE
jgi:DNA-binding response OmpR family regulator